MESLADNLCTAYRHVVTLKTNREPLYFSGNLKLSFYQHLHVVICTHNSDLLLDILSV